MPGAKRERCAAFWARSLCAALVAVVVEVVMMAVATQDTAKTA